MEIDWNSLFATWYGWLGSVNSWLAEPIRSLSDGLGVPLLSAFLFGLLGTTAPCQISTNMGAMAFLARRPSERTATVRATLAYIGAKVLVYSLIGILMLFAGRQLLGAVGPYLDWPRKLVGPLMILLGLVVGSTIRVRLQVGQRLGGRLEQKAVSPGSAGRLYQTGAGRMGRHGNQTDLIGKAALSAATAAETGSAEAGTNDHASSSGAYAAPLPRRVVPLREKAATAETLASGASRVRGENAEQSAAPGTWSSFLLGAGFSLAFCPTLFVLFFGATLSIAARSVEGFTFPAFFALGTVVPLVLFVGLALKGSQAAERLRRGMRRANKPLRWLAAALLILLGLHDTLVYWFL